MWRDGAVMGGHVASSWEQLGAASHSTLYTVAWDELEVTIDWATAAQYNVFICFNCFIGKQCINLLLTNNICIKVNYKICLLHEKNRPKCIFYIIFWSVLIVLFVPLQSSINTEWINILK